MTRKYRKRKALGKTALKVLEVIGSNWPTTPLEVGRTLEPKRRKKSLYGKYLLHFKKLKKSDMINLKQTVRLYIAWPKSVGENDRILKKLRAVKEILKDV